MESFSYIHELDTQSESILQTPELINTSKQLMTAFGLWLDEKGYDKAVVEDYSDPEKVRRRLAHTDTGYFRTGTLDDESSATITAFPIDHFKTITGTQFNETTDRDYVRAHYMSYEASLVRSLEKLTRLSETAAKEPLQPPQPLRRDVVDAINRHATHDDGAKEVVNGAHFATSNTRLLSTRQPGYWLGRLLHARDSAQYALVDAVSPDARLMQGQKTTIADQFLHDVLVFCATNDTYDEIRQLLTGITGYLATAQLLYNGAMKKTFVNISAVAHMTGQPMPEGWQQFQGSTDEFRHIQEQLATVKPGLEGYLQIADTLYNGAMQKTFINISAVAHMTGQPMPEGWQQFQGSTDEFRHIQEQLATVKPGLEGYLQIADTLYNGAMKKTFINISAVAHMTGQPMPEGWQKFQGSTDEFRHIQEQLATVKPGLEGYLQIADTLYNGAMKKTFENISAVAHMTGQPMPEGWQAFQGFTDECRKQRQWADARIPVDSTKNFKEMAQTLYPLYQKEFYSEFKSFSKDGRRKPSMNFACVIKDVTREREEAAALQR